MRGHIRKRGNKWAVVVDVGRDESGRRRQRWHSGFETRREAQKAMTEILARLQGGTYVEPSAQTFGQYLEEWLAAVRASGLRPSTVAGYENLAQKHIAPALGGTPLQKLTPALLNRLYLDMLERGRRDGKGGLSARTVRYTHATIHKALGAAEKEGKLSRNVATLASPPRAERPARPSTWTAAELRRFLEHVAVDRLYGLYHVAASTGARRGEVLGLTWRCVDLDAGRISITQTVVTVDYKVMFSTAKTGHGSRSVALDAETVRVLREHRRRQLEERLALGGFAEDRGLVFCGLDGGPLHPGQVSKRFDRLVRASGLPRIRFHDLRHTHATLALQAGVHPKIVSERLGHADVAITLNTYSHAIPAMEAEAAETVAALVAGG